jgi:hypothetical protein
MFRQARLGTVLTFAAVTAPAHAAIITLFDEVSAGIAAFHGTIRYALLDQGSLPPTQPVPERAASPCLTPVWWG